MRRFQAFSKISSPFISSSLRSTLYSSFSHRYYSSSLDKDLTYLSSKIVMDGQNIDIDKSFDALIKSPDSLARLRSSLFSKTPAPARVAVTGAAGAIGYALLFRIAAGELFGDFRPVIINCLEIPQGMKALQGVKMELEDAAFPNLTQVNIYDDPEKAFEGAEIVFLVGAQPRTKGMDRADLLKKNASIFSTQGKALNKVANRDNFHAIVVGNPANTNCLIASANAPDIHPSRFSAMTRLDHNRGLAQLSEKLNCSVSDIQKFCIWGNHSDTQYPFIDEATVNKNGTRVSIKQTINDDKWVNDTFIPTVAKRGAAIIAARGASSAASAGSAAVDHMRDWLNGSEDWVSMAVWTGDNPSKTPYNVSPDIFYSFPVICSGAGQYKIIKDVAINENSAKRMQATNDELVKEKEAVGELALRKK